MERQMLPGSKNKLGLELFCNVLLEHTFGLLNAVFGMRKKGFADGVPAAAELLAAIALVFFWNLEKS